MLITLSRRTAICQSVAEVYLTGVGPLGAASHRFIIIIIIIIIIIVIPLSNCLDISKSVNSYKLKSNAVFIRNIC